MVAASSGKLELVSLLLKNGAEVNVTDVNGRSALFYAAYYGYVSICELLLVNGAYADNQENKGASPMPEPEKHEKFKVLQLALESKAGTKRHHIQKMTKEKD